MLYWWNDDEQLKPWVTYFIILVSTILVVVSFYLNDWQFDVLERNPMFGPTPEVLLNMGALQTIRITTYHEYYRLLIPMFLHAGILHYCINMLCVWILFYTFEL